MSHDDNDTEDSWVDGYEKDDDSRWGLIFHLLGRRRCRRRCTCSAATGRVKEDKDTPPPQDGSFSSSTSSVKKNYRFTFPPSGGLVLEKTRAFTVWTLWDRLVGSTKWIVWVDVNDALVRRYLVQALFRQFDLVSCILWGPQQGEDPPPRGILPPRRLLQQQRRCGTTLRFFQWVEYERMDWQAVYSTLSDNDGGGGGVVVGASSYMIRKGLSRKAQLALYTQRYLAKHANRGDAAASCATLRNALPETYILDTWSVWEPRDMAATAAPAALWTTSGVEDDGGSISIRQRLHQCLQPLQDLLVVSPEEENPILYILKPSTCNKGAGIRLVYTYEEVLDILWDESDIREWVLQRYLDPPLLLQGRKFHIRAYVVAVGALSVYVSRSCLALCAAAPYTQSATSLQTLQGHLTNTAWQNNNSDDNTDHVVWDWHVDVPPLLVRDGTCPTLAHAQERVEHVWQRLGDLVALLFDVYESETSVYCPLPHCWEWYGVDFMITTDWQVYLLEVNPSPDLGQTGQRLASAIVGPLLQDTLQVSLGGTWHKDKTVAPNNSDDNDKAPSPSPPPGLKLVWQKDFKRN